MDKLHVGIHDKPPITLIKKVFVAVVISLVNTMTPSATKKLSVMWITIYPGGRSKSLWSRLGVRSDASRGPRHPPLGDKTANDFRLGSRDVYHPKHIYFIKK